MTTKSGRTRQLLTSLAKARACAKCGFTGPGTMFQTGTNRCLSCGRGYAKMYAGRTEVRVKAEPCVACLQAVRYKRALCKICDAAAQALRQAAYKRGVSPVSFVWAIHLGRIERPLGAKAAPNVFLASAGGLTEEGRRYLDRQLNVDCRKRLRRLVEDGAFTGGKNGSYA